MKMNMSLILSWANKMYNYMFLDWLPFFRVLKFLSYHLLVEYIPFNLLYFEDEQKITRK